MGTGTGSNFLTQRRRSPAFAARVGPNPSTPHPPGYLPEAVREEFVKLVLDLESLKPGLASKSDRVTLIAFARNVSMFNHICEEIEQRGTTITRSLHGELKMSPLMFSFLQLSKSILAYSKQFGLTPMARASIPVPDGADEDDDNDLDRLLSA